MAWLDSPRAVAGPVGEAGPETRAWQRDSSKRPGPAAGDRGTGGEGRGAGQAYLRSQTVASSPVALGPEWGHRCPSGLLRLASTGHRPVQVCPGVWGTSFWGGGGGSRHLRSASLLNHYPGQGVWGRGPPHGPSSEALPSFPLGLPPGLPGADRSPAGVQPAPGPAEPGPQGRGGGGGGRGGGGPGLHTYRRARCGHLRGWRSEGHPGGLPCWMRPSRMATPEGKTFFFCCFLPLLFLLYL